MTANTDVTGEIAGGTLGGLLHVRDTLLPDYLNRLDTLASSVVSTVNGLHTAGFDVNGNPGVDFFTPSAQVAGTAAAMAVNPAIVSDTTLIAAAGVALAGDNQNARAIADLANGNPSPIDGWASLANAVGVDRDAASADLKTRQDVLSQIETLRQQISGVSVDEERAALLAEYPKGRMPSAEDVAWAVTMLLDPAASAMTGSTLFLDSGIRRGIF